MHVFFEATRGDDLNIGVFGGASKIKAFFGIERDMFNSIGKGDPSTGRP